MASVEGINLDRMLVKIRALLAQADDPAATEAESRVFRAKAEELMDKYRIEEEHLAEQGGVVSDTYRPVSRQVPLCPQSSPYVDTYVALASYVASHVGARGVWSYKFDDDGVLTAYMEMVGFESDLRFAEVIYQSARLVFADRMEPQYDPSLSDEDNVYRMRSAGIERPRIGELMGWGPKAAQKVTTVYKRACRQRGEDPVVVGKQFSAKVFREQYAAGFTSTFWRRLTNARNAADISGGGALVLANRKDKVDEVYYDMFPWARPSTSPAKRSTKPARWTKADEKRWANTNSAAGQAGRDAGAAAANQVAVDGVKPSQRLK